MAWLACCRYASDRLLLVLYKKQNWLCIILRVIWHWWLAVLISLVVLSYYKLVSYSSQHHFVVVHIVSVVSLFCSLTFVGWLTWRYCNSLVVMMSVWCDDDDDDRYAMLTTWSVIQISSVGPLTNYLNSLSRCLSPLAYVAEVYLHAAWVYLQRFLNPITTCINPLTSCQHSLTSFLINLPTV